jgi:hypothetical protein
VNENRKMSAEAIRLLHRMMLYVAEFSARLAYARELVDSAIEVKRRFLEPALNEAADPTAIVVSDSPSVGPAVMVLEDTNDPISRCVSGAELELKLLLTTLQHASNDFPAQFRVRVEAALETTFRILRQARQHFGVQNRQPLHYLEAQHGLSATDAAGKLIGEALMSMMIAHSADSPVVQNT